MFQTDTINIYIHLIYIGIYIYIIYSFTYYTLTAALLTDLFFADDATHPINHDCRDRADTYVASYVA